MHRSGSLFWVGAVWLSIACASAHDAPNPSDSGTSAPNDTASGGRASCSGLPPSAYDAAGASSESSTASAADPSSYWTRQLELTCKNVMTCPLPNDDILYLRPILLTQARCVEHMSEILPKTSAMLDLRAGLASGRFHYDPSRAARCLSSNWGCGATLTGNSADCYEVFDGNVAAGGLCHRDEDCVGNATCVAESGDRCAGV